MMIDRILLERPRHRIVGAEWSESLSCGQRDAIISDPALRGDHELVEIRVGMAAVDVSLAMDPGVELASLDRHTLEIDGSLELESIAPEARHGHHERLGEISLGEIAPMNRRRLGSDHANCLRANLEMGGTNLA